MSWKATAHVTSLSENLTITEKLVLLILAEFHRIDGQPGWPAMKTLAVKCLMTKRGLRQVLNRLEKKEFISRQTGSGKARSCYQIRGLAIEPAAAPPPKPPERHRCAPQATEERGTAVPQGGAQPFPSEGHTCSPPNKDRRDSLREKITGGSQTAPPTLFPALNSYANQILSTFHLPKESNRWTVLASLQAEINAGKSPKEAYTFILEGCQQGQDEGFPVNKFFFQDARYRSEKRSRPNGPGYDLASAYERTQEILERVG